MSGSSNAYCISNNYFCKIELIASLQFCQIRSQTMSASNMHHSDCSSNRYNNVLKYYCSTYHFSIKYSVIALSSIKLQRKTSAEVKYSKIVWIILDIHVRLSCSFCSWKKYRSQKLISAVSWNCKNSSHIENIFHLPNIRNANILTCKNSYLYSRPV